MSSSPSQNSFDIHAVILYILNWYAYLVTEEIINGIDPAPPWRAGHLTARQGCPQSHPAERGGRPLQSAEDTPHSAQPLKWCPKND